MAAITPGQEYESCLPTYYGSAGEEHTRIRVVGESAAGRFGGKVAVVTLTESGREVRRRAIESAQLHPSGLTAAGQPRRTGYRLVRHADGGEA